MILTVTLNASLHVSYEATRITWGERNHIRPVFHRAGGGGLGIARLLAGQGEDVLAAGFAGGGAAEMIEADLARAGVATAFTRIGRESRRVLELVDQADGRSTRLSEPAPFITTEELGRLAAEFRTLVHTAEAVVISGGLPGGMPPDVYATLASYAAEAGVPAIIHAGGPALWHTLGRRPALVLPAAIAGSPGGGASAGTGELLARGAKAAAVVSGCAILAATAGGEWRAALDDHPELSLPGEAVVAGLLPGAAQGWEWPDALRHAVALAAAVDPLGDVDPDAYELFSPEVDVVLSGC